MSNQAAIQLDQVSYAYGTGKLRKQILHSVCAVVSAGEIVILTGPSGSGKTTLLSLIGALRSAQEGSLQVLGRELNKARERSLVTTRRQIGYIFQQHNLLESLTVAQNVQMAMELSGEKSRSNWHQRIEEVLDQVGIAEHILKRPSQLSGGQQQRVGIARALINHPKVILADEPTASLDKHTGRDVVELIQRLAREQGAAVMLVTHDNRILDVADRILHLEDGRIKTLGDAVADTTGRLLNILARHEPGATSHLAIFAAALNRVAYADKHVSDEETEAIKRILTETSDLQVGEIDLIVALSRALTGGITRQDGELLGSYSKERRRHFLEALYQVASADGVIRNEELEEIAAITTELGLALSEDGSHVVTVGGRVRQNRHRPGRTD